MVDLSPEEIRIISGWYTCASGESYGAENDEEFALLDKLGIPAEESDLFERNPEHFVESHRPVIESENEARRAYKQRHPDWDKETG